MADANIGHGMRWTPTVTQWASQLETLIAHAENMFTVEESVTALYCYDTARKRLDKLQAFPKQYRDGKYR